MKSNSEPLDYLIECCEKAVESGYWTLTKFTVLNAKDELHRLREKQKDLPYQNIGCVRINNHGDFYDPRLCYNPYVDESTVMPIYVNREEFKQKYGKLSK